MLHKNGHKEVIVTFTLIQAARKEPTEELSMVSPDSITQGFSLAKNDPEGSHYR
ncbi:MAG: hypothetical protein HZA00_06970 [Nitrospinae bacterium]|nr:hypothetical protein [Nitrospinota bacterium]